MRPAVLFLLFLCFFLLRGHVELYAGGHHSSSHSSVQRAEKSALPRFGNIRDFAQVRHSSFNEKREDFISVEDEDEELDSGKKFLLQAKYFITLACVSIFFFFYNYFKNRLPFCKHLSYTSSYKYILQRVLRL